VNHIGDTNKMVSDTPRTDAELEFDPTSVDEVLDWSRQLERELNASNERIKRLEAVINDPHALWANWLRGSVTLPVGIGDVRQYQDRIKRLEEAANKTIKLAAKHIKQLVDGGDEAIYKTNLFDRELHWNKAKEAKP
jgi:uncharacterized protein (UPF0335 family)